MTSTISNLVNKGLSGSVSCLLVGFLCLVAPPTILANDYSELPSGPYLGFSPMTSSFAVEFDYRKPGSSEHVQHDVWLAAWGMEAGWRLSRHFSLGLAVVNSKEGEFKVDHEYSHALLRFDWNPTGSWWWVSLAGGMANTQGIETFGPDGYVYVPSGSGVVGQFGLGADLKLSDSFVLRARVERLRETPFLQESGNEIDVSGWSLGATLVWFPW